MELTDTQASWWRRRCGMVLLLAASGVILGAVTATLSPRLIMAVLSFLEGTL